MAHQLKIIGGSKGLSKYLLATEVCLGYAIRNFAQSFIYVNQNNDIFTICKCKYV